MAPRVSQASREGEKDKGRPTTAQIQAQEQARLELEAQAAAQTQSTGIGDLVVPAVVANELGLVGGGATAATAAPTIVSAAPVGAEAGFSGFGSLAGSGGAQGLEALTPAADLTGGLVAAFNAFDAGKNIFKGDSKGAVEGITTLAGTGIGAFFGGPIGAGIGSVAGRTLGRGAAKLIGGKNPDQQQRDRFRDQFKEQGTLDENFNLTLRDGSKVNLGLDGGATFTGVDGREVRSGFETDASNPLTNQAAAFLLPLRDLMTQGEDRTSLQAPLVNAIVSNANGDIEVVRSNALKVYKDLGYTHIDQVNEAINALDIPEERKASFRNTLNELVGITPLTPTEELNTALTPQAPTEAQTGDLVPTQGIDRLDANIVPQSPVEAPGELVNAPGRTVPMSVVENPLLAAVGQTPQTGGLVSNNQSLISNPLFGG